LALLSAVFNPRLITKIIPQLFYPAALIFYFTNKNIENYFSPSSEVKSKKDNS